MNLQTFIFIGRSGSGKGTQAKLLERYLAKSDQELRPVYYLETGEQFRKFIKGKNLSSKLSRKIYEEAGLQPSFLAIHFWSKLLIENLTSQEHLIVDGTPRYLDEARVFTAALSFYGRLATVIYLDIPRGVSEARLRERGRIDDRKDADIKKRLDWFDKDVVPAIEYMKNEPTYEFIEIKGDQPIEKVHDEILRKAFKAQ